MSALDALRFPIGSFEPVIAPSSQQREDWIGQIPELSGKLQSVLSHFQKSSSMFLTALKAGRSGRSFIIWRIMI